ncbi:hypothetical protein BGW80DRAFT_384014 [Lactifluus volemus]|nr:hypothetical protein BGW80DRAFT_384014 [Lactifluus volemus]
MQVLEDPLSYPLCNIPSHHPIATTWDSPDAFLNPSTELAVSSFPASTEVDNRIHSVGESSLHDVLNAPSTIESSHRSPPDNVDPADTSLDIITQGLTDKGPTISPTSDSELDPHPAPAVSIFIPHPSFSPPLSSIPDPQTNAGLGVVPDIPSSSFSGTVSNDTPLSLPSTFPTSISLPPPLDITEQSRESAMSVPDLAADASRLQVSPDSVSSSGGIDRPA